MGGSGRTVSASPQVERLEPRVQRDLELFRRYFIALRKHLQARIIKRDGEQDARRELRWLNSFSRDLNQHPRALSDRMLDRVTRYLKVDAPPVPVAEVPLGLRHLPKRPPHRMHELTTKKGTEDHG
jgi:hypothetical protein